MHRRLRSVEALSRVAATLIASSRTTLRTFRRAVSVLSLACAVVPVHIASAEPAADDAAERVWQAVLEERRTWWSLQPVLKRAIPTASDADASAHPVDRFMQAKLDAADLARAEPADRNTLIRRLGRVLTGLTPHREGVERCIRVA